MSSLQNDREWFSTLVSSFVQSCNYNKDPFELTRATKAESMTTGFSSQLKEICI